MTKSLFFVVQGVAVSATDQFAIHDVEAKTIRSQYDEVYFLSSCYVLWRMKSSPNPIIITRPYKCKLCDKRFCSRSGLNAHSSVHDLSRSCCDCDCDGDGVIERGLIRICAMINHR